MLDTVLVVKDSVDYQPSDMLKGLAKGLPEAFLAVTGRLLAHRGRLYRGATFDDPVDGMFSFFPAVPAGGDSGFRRPVIDLPGEYFNPRSWQAPKGLGRNRTDGELRRIWDSLVCQVRDNGLVLGTSARTAREPQFLAYVNGPCPPPRDKIRNFADQVHPDDVVSRIPTTTPPTPLRFQT